MLAELAELFSPDRSLLTMIARGTVVYLALFTMLRLVLNRESGTVGMADMLLVVLIADAAQNAMADEYRSITSGLFLVATLLFWNFALDVLAYRFKRIRRLIHPGPLQLVKDGRLLRRNMRKEFISEDELRSHMRRQGIEDLDRVKAAYMEGDGEISVIENDQAPSGPSHKDSPPA